MPEEVDAQMADKERNEKPADQPDELGKELLSDNGHYVSAVFGELKPAADRPGSGEERPDQY